MTAMMVKGINMSTALSATDSVVISMTDRKAVLSKGRLRCVGSSHFLKQKFGVGYHLK